MYVCVCGCTIFLINNYSALITIYHLESYIMPLTLSVLFVISSGSDDHEECDERS